MAKTFIRELRSKLHSFEALGDMRNRHHRSRDWEVRTIIGRNGESISILEEFDLGTGELINVFWRVDYDPAQRTQLIYG